MERELLRQFSHLYRRIWIMRSKYRLQIIAFPIEPNSRYVIFTSGEKLYHGFGQDTNIEDAIVLIQGKTI